MMQILKKVASNQQQYVQLLQSFRPPVGSILQRNTLATSRMSAFKQTLPRLPVPKLKDTLTKYLRSVTPLLTETELRRTKELVAKFEKQDEIGQKLQDLLLEKAQTSENWLGQWWLNTAYLGYRLPVVVHSSPGLVFPLQQFKSTDDQLNYAAKLIVGAINYKYLIDNDKIPLEMMGKDPLDMSQYKKFFGTIRIPKLKYDGLEYNPTSKHIVIVHRNHFFKLPLWNSNNETINEDQLLVQLKKILEQSQTPAPAIGILSSNDRDKWTVAYEKLIKDPVNAKSVEAIQKALFLLCLDEASFATSDNRLSTAGYQCIHGGGSKLNGGNRWFDKTVQFIVGKDGVVGLTYEHSPSEGQPIAVMTDFVVNYISSDKRKTNGATGPDVEVQKLPFSVNSEIETAIQESKNDLDKLVADFDLQCHMYERFGKDFVKSQKLSPDSFIQMAMQLAFYRIHKQPAAQYESAATRKYIGGRTETIRSCSVEAVEFAKAMLDPTVSDIEKRNALRNAIQSHKQYTIQAVNGLGVDRHLLGLKLIATEKGISLPELFKDKAFTKSLHFRLTSSQVATKCAGFMCYGAVVPDGYALCYNPRDNDIFFAAAAFNADASTSALKYKEAFERSLTEMHDLLVRTPQSKI